MPKYQVRLDCDPADPEAHVGWQTDVPVGPYDRLDPAEIERRAVANAVAAFGDQAADWTLIDYERKR